MLWHNSGWQYLNIALWIHKWLYIFVRRNPDFKWYDQDPQSRFSNDWIELYMQSSENFLVGEKNEWSVIHVCSGFSKQGNWIMCIEEGKSKVVFLFLLLSLDPLCLGYQSTVMVSCPPRNRSSYRKVSANPLLLLCCSSHGYMDLLLLDCGPWSWLGLLPLLASSCSIYPRVVTGFLRILSEIRECVVFRLY